MTGTRATLLTAVLCAGLLLGGCSAGSSGGGERPLAGAAGATGVDGSPRGAPAPVGTDAWSVTGTATVPPAPPTGRLVGSGADARADARADAKAEARARAAAEVRSAAKPAGQADAVQATAKRTARHRPGTAPTQGQAQAAGGQAAQGAQAAQVTQAAAQAQAAHAAGISGIPEEIAAYVEILRRAADSTG